MKWEEKIGKGDYAILYFKIKIHKSRKPFWVYLIPIHTHPTDCFYQLIWWEPGHKPHRQRMEEKESR